jgi:lipoprotein NlpI
MANSRIRSLRWLAPVAVVGAVGLAACGDESASDSTRTVGAATTDNRAALDHEASVYVDMLEERASANTDNRAALDHEASVYVDMLEERASANTDNRAALAHEAGVYVDMLEERASAGR